jgi:hypothetical protein
MALLVYFFGLFLPHILGARRAPTSGWWPCSFTCFVLFLFHFIVVYFYNTHHVLVALPQGVGGLAILFYSILF